MAGNATPSHPRDVVAGLVNDGMAAAVASAAVREALHRAARVRFVQVLPVGLSAEDRSDMDVAIFGVALRALHGQRRVPCTFETVEGEAAKMLVERSRDAAVLVVGRDAPGAIVRVGQYCQEHASCDVLTVSGPDDPEPRLGGAGSAYGVLLTDRRPADLA
ncbi:MAG: universal stress protein [Humibacillus sp.]